MRTTLECTLSVGSRVKQVFAVVAPAINKSPPGVIASMSVIREVDTRTIRHEIEVDALNEFQVTVFLSFIDIHFLNRQNISDWEEVGLQWSLIQKVSSLASRLSIHLHLGFPLRQFWIRLWDRGTPHASVATTTSLLLDGISHLHRHDPTSQSSDRLIVVHSRHKTHLRLLPQHRLVWISFHCDNQMICRRQETCFRRYNEIVQSWILSSDD